MQHRAPSRGHRLEPAPRSPPRPRQRDQPHLQTTRNPAKLDAGHFHTCPVPEIARLGRTLKQWRQEFLGYFDTHRSSNGGTEAINGLIELHRRIAHGFRNLDNYRLRMLLIAGGFHPQR